MTVFTRNLTSNNSPSKMYGLVLVEVTIILPFLFLLMLVSIEGGRLLYSYNTLNKITRDAARLLSTRAYSGSVSVINVSTATAAKVKNFVIYGNEWGSGVAQLENLTASQISVSSSGNYITVASDYPFTSIFGNTISFFGYGNNLDMTMTVHAEVTLRAIN